MVRSDAREYRKRLIESKSAGGDWLPDLSYVEEGRERWLPEGSGFCRFPENCHSRVLLDYLRCEGYRCNATYWRAHNEDVGQVMEIIARHLGKDVNLYGIVGRLHDLDYLKAPHDDRGHIGETSDDRPKQHPTPLVEDLERHGAPREILLAIIEHAPHSYRDEGEQRPGPLSQALFFADNFVTCKSSGCPLGESGYPKPEGMPRGLWEDLMRVPVIGIEDRDTSQPARWRQAVAALESMFPNNLSEAHG